MVDTPKAPLAADAAKAAVHNSWKIELDLVRERSRKFFVSFNAWYGQPFPDDYLVFDCETTGLDRKQDLPWQIGHCVVRDRKVVHRSRSFLNWVGWPGVDDDWLSARIDTVNYHMRKKAPSWPLSRRLLEKFGKPPEHVLSFYHNLFTANRDAGALFVAHNGWYFDAILLSQCMRESCGLEFEFMTDELFDTGCLEKAILMGELPTNADVGLKDYFLRVQKKKSKVKWNVADCADRYDLIREFGVDEKALHSDASMDCYVSHLLFEKHRELHQCSHE